jgi:hypothetical protein
MAAAVVKDEAAIFEQSSPSFTVYTLPIHAGGGVEVVGAAWPKEARRPRTTTDRLLVGCIVMRGSRDVVR